MDEIYRIPISGSSRAENIVQGDCYRFTVLTPSMIRLEYNSEGKFIDQPSQTVWYRSFSTVPFQCVETKESLRIETKNLILNYKKQEFSREALSIEVKQIGEQHYATWHYSDNLPTLKGTVRTLDQVDGAVELEEGLLSRDGVSVIDDSNSYLIKEDGELGVREYSGIDLYVLGYGHEYLTCLHDFYQLTGKTPMLPRYALGNWWSRFHQYTENEYKSLIHRFEEEKIPLSVAIIDMDWHITKVSPEYGSGWTGYTWNKTLFPDPKRFMKWLHEKNLKVSLNMHPADGIRAYEEAYPRMAKALGMDPSKKETVEFDCANPNFLEAYFKYLHHTNEEQGVDFWWVDWQQGMSSKLPGLDPLWVLNHYHYLDISRHQKRPLILSRYAGVGSHRYPIGFSGDSIISWKSLQFQPYFTANASNAGYSWWSHDIGGHMLGTYDEQLQIRWVQFGVFSPIVRLHCAGSIFNHKEPWNYSSETNRIMSRYLRLRHQLIPYLYSMNYRTYQEGMPLICPMYYQYPEVDMAYQVPNEYYWGSEMICLPITEPVNSVVQAALVEGWIPKGIFIDWMTGLIYEGDKQMIFYRSLEQIPILCKAGAIIPCGVLQETGNAIDNPAELEVTICAGADGEFTLYEDDGISMNYQKGECAMTKFQLDYQDQMEFIVHRAAGNIDLIPRQRSYRIKFLGFLEPNGILIEKNSVIAEAGYQYDVLRNEIVVENITLKAEEELRIRFVSGMKLASNDILNRCFTCLDLAQIEFEQKEKIYEKIKKGTEQTIMERLSSQEISLDLYGEISEIVLAKIN